MSGFAHDLAGGSGNLIATALQSPNFSIANQTGWAVFKNGNSYFFNVTATGAVTATVVIAEGPGAGTFIYDGTAAYGTLLVAISGGAGEDDWGNNYSGPGISLSVPGMEGNEIQIRPDLGAMLFYGG